MAQVTDPCPHWADFRMLDETAEVRASQISVLRDGGQSLLYCCHSQRTLDMSGSPHVLSVGVDLVPALRSHTSDADRIVEGITNACLQHHGEAAIPEEATAAIQAVARVLNIAWIEEALLRPAQIICPRSTFCPRKEPCDRARPTRAREITDVRQEIIGKTRRKPQ